MASLTMVSAPVTGRVFAATATKGSGGAKEKSFMDWILGGMQKEDQFFETDPILKKVEDKTSNGRVGTGTTSRKAPAPVVPPKKKFGGLGDIFSKK